MSDLHALALRVAAIPEPSRNIKLYAGALLHAAQMSALHPATEDRDLRQRNTLAVARRRMGMLGAEDLARLEAVEGVLA